MFWAYPKASTPLFVMIAIQQVKRASFGVNSTFPRNFDYIKMLCMEIKLKEKKTKYLKRWEVKFIQNQCWFEIWIPGIYLAALMLLIWHTYSACMIIFLNIDWYICNLAIWWTKCLQKCCVHCKISGCVTAFIKEFGAFRSSLLLDDLFVRILKEINQFRVLKCCWPLQKVSV